MIWTHCCEWLEHLITRSDYIPCHTHASFMVHHFLSGAWSKRDWRAPCRRCAYSFGDCVMHISAKTEPYQVWYDTCESLKKYMALSNKSGVKRQNTLVTWFPICVEVWDSESIERFKTVRRSRYTSVCRGWRPWNNRSRGAVMYLLHWLYIHCIDETRHNEIWPWRSISTTP